MTDAEIITDYAAKEAAASSDRLTHRRAIARIDSEFSHKARAFARAARPAIETMKALDGAVLKRDTNEVFVLVGGEIHRFPVKLTI